MLRHLLLPTIVFGTAMCGIFVLSLLKRTLIPSPEAHEAGELLTVVGALKENATITLVVFTYMLVPKVVEIAFFAIPCGSINYDTRLMYDLTEKCGWSNGLAISLALFALCCAAIGLLFVLVYRNITTINFAPLDRDISHAATTAHNLETTLLPASEIDGLEDGEAVTPSLPAEAASQTLHKSPNFATCSRRAYDLFAYMVRDYKPEYYYYEFFVLARKCAIQATVAFAPATSSSAVRSFILLIIIASSFAIHVRMKAHRDKEMGELESMTLLIGLVSVILAAFVQSEGEMADEFNRPVKKWSVPAATVAFLILNAVVLMWFVKLSAMPAKDYAIKLWQSAAGKWHRLHSRFRTRSLSADLQAPVLGYVQMSELDSTERIHQ